ncbi:hypothetical protein DYB36_010356, partial [Aphanomyces astaci]
MWEARMLRFQENLELTWDKEMSLLLQDKEVSLLALKNQHTDELLRVSTEAEHTIEVRRLEDGGILNQLQEELRSAKHNHTYEIKALVEKTRRSREAQETILDKLQLDASQYSSEREPSERICANCPILEQEKDILTERLRLLEEQLRETDRQRERFEQLWEKGRRQLQESEQRTLVSHEALNDAHAQFQESETRGSQLQEQLLQVHTRYEQELQEEQTLREEMERGVQEQLLALTLDRDSEERRVVTQEREELMKSQEEHEAILQKVSDAQTQLGLNTTLLREEEKTLLREREAFAQEVNKSYSNLRRQQSSLQVDQQTLALQLQEGRLRSGSVGTPYATPASSRKGSPSKGSLSTFMTSSVIQAPYPMAGTPQRTMDPIPVFMQQTEVATETMSMPVPAGVYGRAVTSQKPFMPERPRQREPPEYIPQDSYGMRGHSNPSTPYFTPAHGDRGGVFGGGSSNPPGPPSSYPAPGGPEGHNPFERSGGRGDPPAPPGGSGPGGGGDDHGGGGAPRFPYVPRHDDHGDRPSRFAYADARKYAPKLKRVDSAIPLEHFLKKFDALQMNYGITDAQLVGIFDDRLNESGIPRFANWWARRVRDHAEHSWAESREAFRQEFIMKTMAERMATITADSYRRTGETVNKYACRIGDNIGNANFPPESGVFILLNECEDPIVTSCLRGGPTLPTTIEASLKYLKEKDINLEKPFEGNPTTAMISLGTPGRAPRGLANAPAIPTNEVQELQATVSKMKREMTAMAAKQNAHQQEQISAFHNVVAQMAHEQTPGANNPQPWDQQTQGYAHSHNQDYDATITRNSAAPRAIEESYEDPDGCASETRLQDQECLMTRGDSNSVDDMTTKTGRDESPTNDDDQALGIRRIEYLTDEAHNTPGLPPDATLQTSITQQPNETYTNTEPPRLQAVDPASFKDATIPSPLTNAKADTRPPGLKAAVRSQKTATSQATTTATTPGIQIFKNRRSKKLRLPATPGPRSATSGAPTNLATTPGYETGPSPGVTPARTANRNFENARVAIISDTRWSRFQRKNLASNELPGFGPIPETDCTPPEGDVLPIGGTKIPHQKVCQVGSNPNAPLVQVRIQTADTLALVDTGASVTVISEAFWNELGSPPLQKPAYGLVSASNTPIRTLGLRYLSITLAEKQTTFPVWVLVNSVSPCILGINLLRKLKALVDLSTNCVGFGDSPITLPFHTDDAQTTPRTVAHLKREDPREPPEQKAHEPSPSFSLHNVPTNWPTVHPTSTVYVKSNSCRLVLCHISSDLPEGCPILVESTASLSPLHIARSINIFQKEGFWVQVRNHSDTKLVIRPTDAIGVVTHLPDHYRDHTDTPASDTLPTPSPRSATSLRGGEREAPQEAETLCALTTGAQETSTKPGKEEIQIDWKDSSLSLEQKELLRKLLLRFDLFVSTSKAPGRTDLTKCHINTGDASPI